MGIKLVWKMDRSVCADCVATLENGPEVDMVMAGSLPLTVCTTQCVLSLLRSVPGSVASWVRVSKASCLFILQEVLWWILKSHLWGQLPEAKAQLQSLASGAITQSSTLN